MHGAGHYDSTSEWSLQREDETCHVCATCDERVFVQYSFTKIPSLLVFESVFGSPVSGPEKDRNRTGPRRQKTGPVVRSFHF